MVGADNEGVNVTGPKEIVIHIGPPKTASTTVQRRLAQQRKELATAGTKIIIEHRDAAIELIGHDYLQRQRRSSRRAWNALQGEVASASGNRVIVSNEMFSWLNQTDAQEMVNALNSNDTRVVIGIRLMEKLVTSFWYEVVIRGGTCTLSEWIQELRSADGNIGNLEDPSFRFWHLENSALLAHRWSEVVGRDRVTCVVISEKHPGETLRRFDEALGLTTTGAPSVARVENRSAGYEHLVALVRFNRKIARTAVPKKFRATLARYAHEQLTSRQDIPYSTPWLSREDRAWCAERQSTTMNELSKLGVNVIGDLRDLVAPETELTVPRSHREPVNVDAVAIATRVIRSLVRRLINS